jgi:outer membrane protein insertion porin family
MSLNIFSKNIRRSFLVSLAAVCSFLLVSCSGSKYLPTGEQLYVGAEVHVLPDSGTMSISKQKTLQNELVLVTRPKPNIRFLGIARVKLWFYNTAYTKKEKGLKHLIQTSLGEPPVLFSRVSPKNNEDILKNHLENRGYFNPEVYSKIQELKDRKVIMQYFVKIDRPYTFRKIIFPTKDSSINKLVYNTKDESILRPGMQYNLDSMKKERVRINTAMKEQGLYYFTDEDIIFKVDTTAGDHQVDVYVQVKKRIPRQSTRVYTLNNIYVYANHALFQDSTISRTDTAIVDGYIYIGNLETYRPEIIVKSIYLEKDSAYTFSDYDITLNRLMRLGAYKYVNIKFKALDTLKKTGKLDTYIYLTPLPQKSLRAELKIVSESDDYAGPLINLSLKDRNVFRGAESLTFNVNTSILSQFTGFTHGATTVTFGGDVTFDIPRFITPFILLNPPTRFVPKTELKLGYQKLSEINYYNLNTFNFSAGYKWNQTEIVEHVFNPIVIDFLKLGETSRAFDSLEKVFTSLQRSFATQFVIGSYYSYTYNTQILPNRKYDYFFKGTADVSGNLLGLIQSNATNHYPTPENPNKIFGVPYSQYVLGTLEFRHYINIKAKEERLVTRLFAGIGLPYGNSSSLPYIKEFFAGGNNSVRAFLPGFLGPGS